MTTSSMLQTEKQIHLIKETFAGELCRNLSLHKISAPLAVFEGTGINDDLNGIERPVSFPLKALDERRAEVVHSLAKWKRLRLGEWGLPCGEGILTDMRALRPDEDYSPLHSVYVDQWDWEQCIDPENRNLQYLRQTVQRIYEALQHTEDELLRQYATLSPVLPPEIHFIHAEALLQQYPHLTPREREQEAARRHGAVFIIGIGAPLSDGLAHDGRAPDYDDWSTVNEEGLAGLNGDIVLWHPGLERAVEVSSMGIRVDRNALVHQLSIRDCRDRENLFFHHQLLQGGLPQSIGGGIGQSRVCLFLLQKVHIGEVQVGLWSAAVQESTRAQGVRLL